jgi:hypothetical protein
MKQYIAAGTLAAATTTGFAQDAKGPAGYPANHASVIDGSRSEGGLAVYSNMTDTNWQPLRQGFRIQTSRPVEARSAFVRIPSEAQ